MGLKNAQVFCVYKHTSPNGKVYIGITSKKPEHRWNHGKAYVQNKHFYNAITHFGWDAFTHDILYEHLSRTEACSKEIELIAEYRSNTQDHGYNLSIGGETSALGSHRNQEQRNAMSKLMMGHAVSEETARSISKAKKGRPNGLTGRTGERCMKAGTVLQIDEKTGSVVGKYYGYPDMHRRTGFALTPVKEAASGARKRAYGYQWKYIKRGVENVTV